jgi:hypothetical protein
MAAVENCYQRSGSVGDVHEVAFRTAIATKS